MGLVNGKPSRSNPEAGGGGGVSVGFGTGGNLLGESPRPPPLPTTPATHLGWPEGPPGAGHTFGGVSCGLFKTI